MEIYSRRIREVRTRYRFTQERLAELSGVSREYINQVEMGKRRPSIAVLNKIASAFHMEGWQFLVEPREARRLFGPAGQLMDVIRAKTAEYEKTGDEELREEIKLLTKAYDALLDNA